MRLVSQMIMDIDEELDKGDDRIFMMDIQGTSSNPAPGNNAIVKAQHPIANGFNDDPFEVPRHNGYSIPDPNTNISFVLDFAKSYANTYLAENRQVLIISNAIGSSPISNWVPGGQYMNKLIERLNIALNLEGENRVVAMLWHQGEADASMAEATYKENLLNVINTVRTAVGNPNLPFIGGQTTGGAISDTVWQKLIQENSVSNIGFASSVGAEHSSKESVHFSSAGYRFMAVKYFEQYQNIVSTNQEGGEGTTTTPPTTNEDWQTAVVTDFKTTETGIPILSGNSISTGNATSEGFQYVVANDGVKAIRFKATFNESSLSAFDSVISILLGEDTNNYYAMNVAAF